MGFNARVLRVLIACPGDVDAERDAIVETLLRWNGNRAEGAGLLYLPRYWKVSAVPQLTGSDGQTVINEQLVKQADIVIAVFWSRLGAATPRAVSGTAEELQHARDAGKPVHVWFSRAGYPADVDPDQLKALRDFKQSLRDVGLYGEYDDVGDLSSQVTTALELDASTFADEALGEEIARPARRQTVEGVRLRATYRQDRESRIDNRGQQRYHTTNTRIEVENQGEATAYRVRLEPNLIDGQPTMEIHTDSDVDIIGHSTLSFPALPLYEVHGVRTLTISWIENDQEHEVVQTLSVS